MNRWKTIAMMSMGFTCGVVWTVACGGADSAKADDSGYEDDGAGGGVAAKYLKRVVVMRRKSYDPAMIFSNPHSAECEGKPTPFDPKTRVLPVMVDPPPVQEDAEEPQAADA